MSEILFKKVEDLFKATVLPDGIFIEEILPEGCGQLNPLLKKKFFAAISYNDMKNLSGRVLTVIDASIQDKQQNKAVKDIMKKALWIDWVDTLFTGSDRRRQKSYGVPFDDQL